MADIGSRLEQAVADLTGNESLLGMLEADAASAMLDWGVEMSKAIVNETGDLNDDTADQLMVPRLKAVRSSMRSIGNWAVGKYIEPEDRIDLRDKLLERFRAILGDDAQLPAAKMLDDLLNQVDEPSNTPHQLIFKLIELMGNKNQGEA